MRERRVAIVYRHPLFGRGIESLLEAEPRVQVVSVDASQSNAAEELRRFLPQVMIVEGDGQGPALTSMPAELLDTDWQSLMIVLNIRAAEMQLFYKRRVCVATPDSLLAVVLEGHR